MLVLVTGGAGSGKSVLAENLVGELAGKEVPQKIYLATMRPFGEEAQARIRRHRAQRRALGMETLECYADLEKAQIPQGSDVLLEDLSNLLANEMFLPPSPSCAPDSRCEPEAVCPPETTCPVDLSCDSDPYRPPKNHYFPGTGETGRDPAEAVWQGISALAYKCRNLVIVTNEVFTGGSCYEGETGLFLQKLACLNRRIAARAELVVEAVCGIPLVLKDRSKETCRSPQAPAGGIGAGLFRKTAGGAYHLDPVSPVAAASFGRTAGVDTNMIFVTGPLYAGKRNFIKNALGMDEETFADRAVWDVQELVEQAADADLEALADRLSEKQIVIATEVGGGVVPVDAQVRRAREAAGRLACLLAARADTVIRVNCGLGQVLKGSFDLDPEGTAREDLPI